MPTQHADERRNEVIKNKRTATPAATSQLLARMEDDDPLVREWAVEAMIGRRDRVKAVPALIERLQDDRADLRWYAARALGKLGIATDEIRQALGTALDDPDLYVRCFAAWAIGQLRFSEEIPNLQARLLRHRAEVGRKDEEAFSLGVALARLNTASPRNSTAVPLQQSLFPDPPQAKADASKDQRPKTKRQRLEEELLSTADATRIDRAGGTAEVRVAQRNRWEYARRQIVKERVLAERGRSCQLCGFTFRTTQGNDYAEAHHVIPVSEQKLDNPDNILVLCANHHRQMHYAAVEWPDGPKRPPVVLINGDRYPIRWTR
jgi:hypothetical protein